MSSKPRTCVWPWQQVWDRPRQVKVTSARVDAIRQLLAVWDVTETGAPGLVLADGDELGEEIGDFVHLFLEKAVLKKHSGKISNPWLDKKGGLRKNISYFLDYIDDDEIKALLNNRSEFRFVATKQEIMLWREAVKTPDGIDAKRPFGSTGVIADFQQLVDPGGELSRKELVKLKDHLFARLILFLQYFVQTAYLPIGDYYRVNHEWLTVEQFQEAQEPERLEQGEWVDRIVNGLESQCDEYLLIGEAVITLIRADRIGGGYQKLDQQLKIGAAFFQDLDNFGGDTLEQCLKAIDCFGEQSNDPDDCWFTLVAVRILNANCRFSKAYDLLMRAGLSQFEPGKLPDRGEVSLTGQLVSWELLIIRAGLENYSADQFDVGVGLVGVLYRRFPGPDLRRLLPITQPFEKIWSDVEKLEEENDGVALLCKSLLLQLDIMLEV